ncbi:Sorbitol dehydrogenase [Grifola frondosa]|uniref:Sorbitol dehydrogenase n=1 Tax=Grifola frondosa TaxID=5627 RepID=A0A1C7LK08_GRIFR|nr:Sorbitol dehydrogenase [Grifola frondosa]
MPDAFDVVFKCTGAEPCIQTSIYAAVTSGKVMLPLSAAATREVDVHASFRYTHTYPTALALLAEGKLSNIEKIITHCIALQDPEHAPGGEADNPRPSQAASRRAHALLHPRRVHPFPRTAFPHSGPSVLRPPIPMIAHSPYSSPTLNLYPTRRPLHCPSPPLSYHTRSHARVQFIDLTALRAHAHLRDAHQWGREKLPWLDADCAVSAKGVYLATRTGASNIDAALCNVNADLHDEQVSTIFYEIRLHYTVSRRFICILSV